MLRPLTAKAFEYKEKCVHPTLPGPRPLPHPQPRKIRRARLTQFFTLMGPSHTIPAWTALESHVNFLRVSYNILRGSYNIKEEQTGVATVSSFRLGRGVVKLTYILFKPCSWSLMLAKQRTWGGDRENGWQDLIPVPLLSRCKAGSESTQDLIPQTRPLHYLIWFAGLTTASRKASGWTLS